MGLARPRLQDYVLTLSRSIIGRFPVPSARSSFMWRRSQASHATAFPTGPPRRYNYSIVLCPPDKSREIVSGVSRWFSRRVPRDGTYHGSCR